ncbi:MAG: divergent polysaccharide deacetylase family protein [Acidobacteria bacterium]|nr:divergent polysaccharide deacetylase family protein [Acidobacteriota bacterium]
MIALFLGREKSPRRIRRLFALSLGATLAFSFLIAGCKKLNPLNAAEIHVITHEFVNAAKSEGPLNVSARTTLDATDNAQGSTDHITITLRQPSSQTAARADRALVLQALDDVAVKHELTRTGMIENREGLAFKYLRGEIPTHTIHISETTIPAVELAPNTNASPRLAIILDDLGQDYAVAEAVFALGYPLTISVLPNNPHSVDIAKEAHRRGFEVMLHLPMESVSQRHPESHELRPGMSQRQVSALVNGFIAAVPDVSGVNNHQGSESTANIPLMNELMPVLREHKLFYIDSRTTAASIAFDAARHAGVPAAYRNVPFLDDVAEVGAVSRQLRLALREAREKNEAIAIGHPHPATLKALREVLPDAKAQGVRLVYASELVR